MKSVVTSRFVCVQNKTSRMSENDNCVICVSAVSNPIPSNMRSEAKKAAKILREFTEISNRNGPDKLIPGKKHKHNKNVTVTETSVLSADVTWFLRARRRGTKR